MTLKPDIKHTIIVITIVAVVMIAAWAIPVLVEAQAAKRLNEADAAFVASRAQVALCPYRKVGKKYYRKGKSYTRAQIIAIHLNKGRKKRKGKRLKWGLGLTRIPPK